MIVDCVTFNGEYDLLEIRLNILDKYVDQFIIIESNKTFSGKDKPLYYGKEKHLFSDYSSKIRYHVVDSDEAERSYGVLADSSPNVPHGGPRHWRREFCQKEAIRETLVHLKDDDSVFIGDADEIWDLDGHCLDKPSKLKLEVYTYYLNNKSSEQFWGTLFARYGDIKNECLNHLRTNAPKTICTYGWHFTSLRDYMLERKMTDSYTEDSYASPWVMANLENNIDNNKDFLGRGFTYQLDESDWPDYLKKNKRKYIHLCKQ